MFLKHFRPAILAATVLTLQVAVAQVGRSMARQAMQSDDAGIVTGQPCIVVEKTESVRPSADRTPIEKRTEVRKWRDSKGRFRKETTAVEEGQSPVFHSATNIDPVKNTLTIHNLDSKAATVVHLPDQRPEKLHKYIDLDDKPLEAMPGVELKVEKLKDKSIAGENAVGRRVTRTRLPGTIGNRHYASNNPGCMVSLEYSWIRDRVEGRSVHRSAFTLKSQLEPHSRPDCWVTRITSEFAEVRYTPYLSWRPFLFSRQTVR